MTPRRRERACDWWKDCRAFKPHRNLKAPCLTQKEIRHLNSQLPKKGSSRRLHVPGVPTADVERYAEVYRYFPSFSEVLIP
ncbi:MAG: O-methyltransferase [Limisphaerales bacterium]